MNSEEMIRLCKAHNLWSWSSTKAAKPFAVERAEGVYLYTPEGRQLLDFNSQLMSVNIGHGHPKVREAMKAQIDQLTYVVPSAATEIRARLGKKLAEIMPGALNTSFFTLGGADANENAIRIARQFTGRQKIISRQRSYHGGTSACMQMSGDPRRWGNEPGAWGFIRVMHEQPYGFSFGESPEARADNYLKYIKETIQAEGPQTIAAMILETVTGTNGILPPPPGLLPRLKELLSEHGILLIADEVMAGFGRTGKLMAFEHFGVEPDLVTAAKGLTSSYAPLGAVIMSDAIADHFEDNTYWGGLTYNAHALCLAASLAAVEVLIEEGMIENAAERGLQLSAQMAALKEKHPSIRAHRNLGLFGIIELQGKDGAPIAPYNSSHPAMAALGKFLFENGLFTVQHWDGLMVNPPLCITAEQLEEGLSIIDAGLSALEADW